jgi:carbamoyltransferase
MVILGISCFYHDAAACLLKNGVVVAASEEERFSRIKHDRSFPQASIDFCLKSAKLQSSDIDFVVFHEKPFLKFERLIKTIAQTAPLSLRLFQNVALEWMTDKLWIKSLIEEKLNITKERIKFCEHHLSHAASSFYCSPFEEAAILTCDGVGEWATCTYGIGHASWKDQGFNHIDLFKEIRFPHSLGLFYSAFTAFLGFEVNEGEYKVMGMAAFGTPKYKDKIRALIKIHEDGSFWLDMKYFSFHHSTHKSFNRRFLDLFGPARNPKSRFVTSQTSLYDDVILPTKKEIDLNQYYADIASSIQKVTEDILVHMSKALFKKTGLKKLCLAGGVSLNCLANTRILKESGFDEVFIQPAAGDSGAAMGAALYCYHSMLQQKRIFELNDVFLGPDFPNEEIKQFLDKNGIRAQYHEDHDILCQTVAESLTQGKVIGWFQGPSEWGPRALGNRSILADPRDEKMKDVVNIKIKFREPFRPFAPTVLAEHCHEFFEMDPFDNQVPLKFMLYTVPVKRKSAIPAVTHVDGSGRLQVLHKEDNPLFYQLIELFFKKTGIPVLLNTSFNLKGEPIVCTPDDAYHTFQNSSMDLLVLGDYILSK